MFAQEYLWNFVLAVIAATVGAITIGISFFRRRHRNLSLSTFGATSLLYGLRLLANVQLNQYSSSPPQAIIFFISFCTYIIPVPLSGFILHLFGKGLKNTLLWTFRITIVFAIAAIFSDVIQTTAGTMMSVNNVLVIIWSCVMFVNFFSTRQDKAKELQVVLFGFLIFGVFALNENLVHLNLVPWTWSWEELGFLVFLSSLGYVSVSRFFNNEARLITIEREMEIARQIQSSILPQGLPKLQGLDIIVRYIPMTSVAGDFYDILIQDEKHVCIFVADVSGHGVGAALIASMLKVAFASQHNILYNPALVLDRINHILADKLDNNFVTAGCLFIDMDANTIQYASAGHPPLLIYRKSENKIYEVSNSGVILGPFPNAQYEVVTISIETGDRLILYTDGISETKNTAGRFFGEEELKYFITTHSELNAEDFTTTLIQYLTQWSGKSSNESLNDDLTLIVIDKL